MRYRFSYFRLFIGGVMLLLLESLTLSSQASAQTGPPDIRGTYRGTVTETRTNCSIPQENGTFTDQITISIFSQVGETFSAAVVLQAAGDEGINFVGIVTPAGQVTGRFASNSPNGSTSAGTFTGQVSGNTLSLNTSGQSSPFCLETATISATRVASGSPPDIRGTYRGTLSTTRINCGDNATHAVTVNIFDQVGETFSGVAVTEEGAASLFGTVTAAVQVNGKWTLIFSRTGDTGEGTFAGQVSGNALSFNFSGQVRDRNGRSCAETDTISATRATSSLRSDLALTNTTPSSTASGNQLTYSLAVSNAGPDPADGVVVSDSTPVGATFASITTGQGTCTTPSVGEAGVITCFLGSMPTGSSATISFAVNVLAAGGSTLSSTPEVSSLSSDPNPANNSATASTSVQGGGIVELAWNQTASTETNQTPAPSNLRVNLASLSSAGAFSVESIDSPGSTCTIFGYSVYSSPQQPVQPSLTNLVKTLPPTSLLITNVPVPSKGAFFVVTAIWQCRGAGSVESGPSNPAGVPGGGTINSVGVSSKLVIRGSGFSDDVEVFLDGVGFTKQGQVSGGTKIKQKGGLADGRTIDQILTPGKSALLTVRNSNGGIASFRLIAQ